MNKTYYSWQDVETAASCIMLSMQKDPWYPDWIVGLSRGGLPLATILSNRLGVPMQPLVVSLRDGEAGWQTETNCWLPELAFGYVEVEEREIYRTRWDISKRKNILIVDDINDTGATFNWIKKDWESSVFPNERAAWDTVWDKNVRFAVMTQNWGSSFEPDYWWHEVNKAEKDCWLVYPWEKESWLKRT